MCNKREVHTLTRERERVPKSKYTYMYIGDKTEERIDGQEVINWRNRNCIRRNAESQKRKGNPGYM